MKLEFKHIVPYLPYGLQIYGSSEIWILFGIDRSYKGEIFVNLENGQEGNENFYREASMFEHSLILHPLSDLTKEKLSKYYTQLMDGDLERCIKDTLEYPLNQSYTFIQYLLSEHYDIFGLIKEDLAIDINTLK
jgi:hypothetical protein